MGRVVLCVTLDGRTLVGLLRGADPLCNLVLEDAHERVFGPPRGCEHEPLGLYIVRGDSVAVLGELDAEKDKAVDWAAAGAAARAPGAIVIRAT